MKKLLTTMSAVAVAMSLYAAGAEAADPGALSGTSFEGLTAGDALNITDPTGELKSPTAGYWRTNGTDTLTIKEGTSVVVGSSARAKAFSGELNERYLEVKTASLTESISRFVNADGSAENIDGGTATTKGLYFDSYVRFTAFDEDQTIDLGSGGKLAIWLKEVYGNGGDGDPTGTNLVITAGYLDSSLAGVVVTNYNCEVVRGTSFNDGGWHRVTVKAIDNIYTSGAVTPGFVVFIDGNYVYTTDNTTMGISGSLTGTASEWSSLKALFPSACQGVSGAGSVTAVDFAGQGDVDELVFTRTAPFDDAKDIGIFTITVPAEGVTRVTFTTNNVDVVITTTTTLTITDALKNDGIKIVAEYADGKMGGTWTGLTADSEGYYYPTDDGDAVGIVTRDAVAYVGGVAYGTLAEAVTAANGASSDCTFKLYATTTEGIALDNANAKITIDLAGNTIAAAASDAAAISVAAGTTVAITNSVGTGTVQAAVNEGQLGSAVFGMGTVEIQDGVYNGVVFIATRTITGGSFLATYGDGESPQTVNEAATLNTWIVEGYEATLADNYYTLTEAAPTYTVKYVYGLEQQSTNETANLKAGDPTPAAPAEAEITGYTLTWQPATNATVSADATYIAQYTANAYTITYYDGVNVLDLAPANYTYGTGVSLPASAGAKTGYTFDGWYDNAGLAGDPVTAVAANETGNQTFYAKYTADTYTITFVNEIGADPAAVDYTIASGEIVLPTATTSNEGVQFAGWTNNTYTTAITNFTPTAENLATFTLYAKWEETGSGSFDGGDGASFTIDPSTQATIEAVLPAGKTLSDAVSTGSSLTYAQAYALGLLNTSTGDVADLDATIELKDGKVVVGLTTDPLAAYTITLKVYEKSSLTDQWPVSPTQTYTLDDTEATTGFTPAAGASNFYKTEVTISNK